MWIYYVALALAGWSCSLAFLLAAERAQRKLLCALVDRQGKPAESGQLAVAAGLSLGATHLAIRCLSESGMVRTALVTPDAERSRRRGGYPILMVGWNHPDAPLL